MCAGGSSWAGTTLALNLRRLRSISSSVGGPAAHEGPRMDIATLIGIISGFGLVFAAIAMGSPLSSFIDPPSMLIVFGGTAAATLIAERLEHVIGGFKVAANAFFSKTYAPESTIKLLGELAAAARKDGILALEKVKIDDKFLAKGVRLAVDGIAPEEIRSALQGELISMRARHKRGQKLFRIVAGVAPSMGMIGTLIGLVQMLQQLDDPSKIGPAMAIALLTTFYGAMIAFLFASPIADKLERRTDEETASMNIALEGIDGILRGENPRLIQERLEGFLAPRKRSEKK